MRERLLRRPEVERVTGLARSSIYRLMQSGDFPRPVKVGPAAVRWRESDIDGLAGIAPHSGWRVRTVRHHRKVAPATVIGRSESSVLLRQRLAGQVFGPPLHQGAATLEQIGPSICLLGGVAQGVGESRLGDGPWRVSPLERPVLEAASEPVHCGALRQAN